MQPLSPTAEDRLPLGVRSVPDGGHGITTIPALVAGLDRTGAAVMVDRERAVGGGANASTAHYYLTGLREIAEVLAGDVRSRWGIENGLPGVAFREDESRARAGHAGANLGIVRRVALSLLEPADTKGAFGPAA